MMSPLSHLIIIFAAFIGFFICWYIRHKKAKKEHLVCPLYQKCDQVIHSNFSIFLGIPIELLGLAYYLLTAIGYGILLAIPAANVVGITFPIFSITAAAFLFSIYLTFIQAFALREFCSWCLTSAALCTIIFFTGLTHLAGDFTGFLAQAKPIILVLHMLGIALGLGAATIADMFFFKFLRDFKISEFEAEVLHNLTQIIWLGLAILVLTGFGLFLPQAAVLMESAKFLLKALVVAVIIINGSLLNLYVSPRLVHISFGEEHNHIKGELHNIRKIAFALGGVSITSWYTAFILGSIESLPFSLVTGVSFYAALVLVAVFISQMIEKRYSQRAFE